MKKVLYIIIAIASGLPFTAFGAKKGERESLPSGFVTEPAAQAGAYMYAGTSAPYPETGTDMSIPDSLEVIFVNHAGRHGARYLSSAKFTGNLLKYLDSCGELTPAGERVRRLCQQVDSISANQWGALDSLGIEEQSGIGKRFALRYGQLMKRRDSIVAIASYIPRCIMSMDQMTHGIAWQERNIELSAGSGRRFNHLLRFFGTDSAYIQFKANGEAERVWEAYCAKVCPIEPIRRLSKSVSALSDKDTRELSMDLYNVVAGSMCGTIDTDWRYFFKEDEYRRLWECANLKHYLTYSWSGLSDIPVRMAQPLLDDLRITLEEAATPDYSGPAAILRFGHAETMMPLLGLLGLPGCRYVTSNWDSVSSHWIDTDVAPMAVNLQMALCRSKTSGILYLQVYLNERAVIPLMPWKKARLWLLHPADGVSYVSGNKASLW